MCTLKAGLLRFLRVGLPAAGVQPTDPVREDLLIHAIRTNTPDARIRIKDSAATREWGNALAPAEFQFGRVAGDGTHPATPGILQNPYTLNRNNQLLIDCANVSASSELVFLCERLGVQGKEITTPMRDYLLSASDSFTAATAKDVQIGNYNRDLYIIGAVTDLPEAATIEIEDPQRFERWMSRALQVGYVARRDNNNERQWNYPVAHHLAPTNILNLSITSPTTGSFFFAFLCQTPA